MLPVTGAAAIADALKERWAPAIEDVEEGIRRGRHLIARGRHAAEDGLATSTMSVRRHPLRSVALAVSAGALLGGVLGFVFARRGRCEHL